MCGVEVPVANELLRAENEDLPIEQLVILDDGKGGVCLAQAHAVGEDAAVVRSELCEDASNAVLLKGVEGVPYLAAEEAGGVNGFVARQSRFKFIAEQFVERLVVHGFRRVVASDAVKGIKYLLLRVLNLSAVVPQAIEPFLQFGKRFLLRGREVDFQVGAVAAAKSALCEVGAADYAGCGSLALRCEVHLAVQEVGLLNGADMNAVSANPLGAALSEMLLV